MNSENVTPEVTPEEMIEDKSEEKGEELDVLTVPEFDIPYSYYMSEEARRCSLDIMRTIPSFKVEGGDVQSYCEMWDRHYYLPRFRCAKDIYPVDIRRSELGGVDVDIIEPKTQSEESSNKVLINLHGGAFMIGSSMGGLIESIPVAHVSQIKVVSVDYRQAPEHKFPAASEDVVAVYQALLEEYRPENIGIFGCSAGGLLTAMVVSWLIDKNIPLPGAIGVLCAPADCRFDGDSRYFTPPLVGGVSPAPGDIDIGNMKYYLSDVDPFDPLVSPAESPERLACFPPTLLATGTRAGELSSVVHTHNRLVTAGVDANLHVWDGMWHGFFYDTELPESRELFSALTRFFEKHLGPE